MNFLAREEMAFVSLFLAFACCALGIMQNTACDSPGCRRLASVGYPMAALSCLAASLIQFMIRRSVGP